MTNNYKFTVLMSVYCKENPQFLALALKSNLTEQTLKPDEFILVCDGPLTNELDRVIEEYRIEYPELLKIFRLPENAGLGNALNFGLEKCQYNIIARSDSDDICSPDRFLTQINYLKSNPSVDIVSSYIDEFDHDYKNPINKKQLPIDANNIKKMATFRNPINHMAVMFKKNVVINSGSYQHLPYLEDYFLWIRALKNGAILANIDKYLVHARVGNGMIERRGNIEYIQSWKILSRYMLKEKMINRIQYLRNMVAVRGFIYMPVKLKSFAYKNILRNQ